MYADTGILAIGGVPWGSHFCHFYDGRDDLSETLVPYFKAGLDNREKCLWVTSDPLAAEQARAALRDAVPDLAARESGGDIEIIDHDAWYHRNGELTTDAAVRGWLEREQAALANGYGGLRLTGNTFWLGPHQWRAFADYEAAVNQAFRGRRILALCSYCLSRCQGGAVLDVVRNHEFAVTRREGVWEVVESSSLAAAKAELIRANRRLEQGVAERTAELTRALADMQVLYNEVHHRVRNNLQVIQSLISLRARRVPSREARAALAETASQVQAIGLVHSALYRQETTTAVEMGAYLQDLAQGLIAAHGIEPAITFAVEDRGAVLPLAEATSVGLIAHEVILNALKHAFPDGRPGRIEITCGRGDSGGFRLAVRDNGVGIAQAKLRDRAELSGLQLIQGLVRQARGRMDIAAGDGTVFILEIPEPQDP